MFRPASGTRRNSHRGGVDLCLVKTAPKMMNRFSLIMMILITIILITMILIAIILITMIVITMILITMILSTMILITMILITMILITIILITMILITLLITRTPSPPPIRSYQRDLIRYMVEAQAADSMSLQSNEVITMICMSIQSN